SPLLPLLSPPWPLPDLSSSKLNPISPPSNDPPIIPPVATPVVFKKSRLENCFSFLFSGMLISPFSLTYIYFKPLTLKVQYEKGINYKLMPFYILGINRKNNLLYFSKCIFIYYK